MGAYAKCTYCDGGCYVKSVEREDGIGLVPLNPDFPAICSKAGRWKEVRNSESRLMKPLENVGKRGEPIWREISWEEALDKISERLKSVIEQYGSEAVAFSEHPLNHGFGGITRRFMNHLGSPNYITPLDLCMGNTAQIHRTTYGWFTSPDWEHADCIVFFGQNRGPNLWPAEFLKLKAALDRGAKLIVIDPRITDTAKLADCHLRVNYGTDAALALSMIHTIIEERLYDESFVEEFTIGFSQLAERVSEYTPETVESICGVEADQIREVARIYSSSDAAIIPWGVTADMQKNSTSLLRAQCILRSICGFINKSEMVFGPGADEATMSMVADFDALPQEKRDLQIGTENYPLFTFKGGSLYDARMKEEGVKGYQDLLASSAMAHPSTLFAAMRGEGPYPVKAFFSVAQNTLMSYANMQGIVEAFANQDLVVVFENNMTATAQMADFVLPGDQWMERDNIGPFFDIVPALTASFSFVDKPGECKDWYFVIKGLADRMGIGDAFPWKDASEFNTYLVEVSGLSWDDLADKPEIFKEAPWFGKFLTPSGKVELTSSVLEDLGYDPLPYYQESCEPDIDLQEFPYVIFVGSREPGNYNTNLHQIPFLRSMNPEPELFINPEDAETEGIEDGQWVKVSTAHGSILLVAKLDTAQMTGSLRVPHGWWKPETTPGLEGGLSESLLYNDGVLFPDAEWNLDHEQGLANLRGGIHATIEIVE